MKRKRNGNNGKPVTMPQMQQVLKLVIAPIYKRFDGIDQRLDRIDRDIDELKVTAKKSGENIEILLTHADGFADRIEEHEEDIVLLNGHHADLAKFCTKKPGYHYGDNL